MTVVLVTNVSLKSNLGVEVVVTVDSQDIEFMVADSLETKVATLISFFNYNSTIDFL